MKLSRFPVFLARVLLTLSVTTLPATAAFGQQAGKVMLVLDASGSMWGRVEEREKILIAREVVGQMLDQWDPALDLGLVAYGHRTKGDCGDIETLVPVGGSLDQIRATVNGLQPRGKTPLSAAVQQAAEHLRFTEDKATVILVSDGRETCDLDPCEVGRNLEQLGVDFTAHVIGFDIAEADRAGLACLATETGGQYFDAQKTDELKAALAEAVEKIKQQPDTVVALLGSEGVALADARIKWTAANEAGESIDTTGASLSLPLEPGTWSISAQLDDLVTDGQAVVTLEKSAQHVVIFDAGVLELSATVRLSGKTVSADNIAWSIIRASDETEIATATGKSVTQLVPSGNYQVVATYEDKTRGTDASLLAGERKQIDVSFDIQLAKIAAPENVPVSATFDVGWEGPDGKGDYITVVEPDADDRKYGKYFYTTKGSPAELIAPDKPGIYELRYNDGDTGQVLARRPINVDAVALEIVAPSTAPVSKPIKIEWRGPDGKSDYFTVVTPETDDGRYGAYTYTQEGSPLSLVMPDTPGTYEIRYVSAQSKSTLARKLIEVEAVEISLEAVDTTPISAEIEVSWRGPDGARDYLSIAKPEQADNRYINYSYTSKGSPLKLQMPDSPGAYEIRYVSSQSGEAMARRPIMVEGVEVSMAVDGAAAVSKPATIIWQGPNGARDYLTVVEPGEEDRKYGKYIYTSEGSPLKLLMPDLPGTYELRYVSGQSKQVLGRQVVQVMGVQVSLTAPDSAKIGESFEVHWQGPGGERDQLTIVPPEADDNAKGKYWYTQHGNPLRVSAPDTPGVYEIRYLSGQSKLVQARKLLQVENVAVSFDTLGIAIADEPLKLHWTGPETEKDRIVVAELTQKDEQAIRYTFANQSPVSLQMPREPGMYELRYVTDQSKQVLIRKLVQVVTRSDYASALANGAPGKLQVSASRAGTPVTENLKWQIYGVDGVNKSILDSTEGTPTFELPMGMYRVNLSSQQGSASRDVIIDANSTISVDLELP